MKISKDMLHTDLQPHYWKANALRPVFSNKLLHAAFNAFVDRTMKGREVHGLDCSEVFVPGGDGKTQIRTRIYKLLDHNGPLPD